MQAVDTVDETPEEDEYELPPHVFAQVGRGVVRLFRIVFPQPLAPTRWRYVWQSLFLALAFACFSGPLSRHLPWRFLSDARWQILWDLRLMDDLRSSPASFLRGLAIFGKQVVLIGPLQEELLYRGLPILFARFVERRLPSRTGKAGVVAIGVCSSVYFAWGHNPISWSLPLPQLTFGLVAWWMAWNRGLRYSWLMHASVNLLFLAMMAERIWMFTSRH